MKILYSGPGWHLIKKGWLRPKLYIYVELDQVAFQIPFVDVPKDWKYKGPESIGEHP